jgi:hypothetical protein
MMEGHLLLVPGLLVQGIAKEKVTPPEGAIALIEGR